MLMCALVMFVVSPPAMYIAVASIPSWENPVTWFITLFLALWAVGWIHAGLQLWLMGHVANRVEIGTGNIRVALPNGKAIDLSPGISRTFRYAIWTRSSGHNSVRRCTIILPALLAIPDTIEECEHVISEIARA